MTSKKQLYESVQALQGQIRQLQGQVLTYETSGIQARNEINPQVCNVSNYTTVLSVQDKVQAVSRYITDIPETFLPSNRLEALFYCYGSLCFFKEGDRVLITSYAKTGDLNGLGDLTTVEPIDFAGKKHSQHRTVVYTNELVSNPCVIIDDYTGAYTESQIIPRRALNLVSILDQASVYKQLKNSIILTAKKAIAFIDSQTQAQAILKQLNDMVTNDAPVMAVVGQFNDLVKMFNIDTNLDMEGYMNAIETFEKLRANFNGISTRSPYEKKERQLESEVQHNSCLQQIYLYDGLINRQIGIELMKKHAIISQGSCVINPLLIEEQEKEEDDDKSQSKNSERNKDERK